MSAEIRQITGKVHRSSSQKTSKRGMGQGRQTKMSYPEWEADFEQLRTCGGKSWKLERLQRKMHKKQCAHDGDRSHPQLMALDSLELTYPGWEEDLQYVEKIHFDFDGKVFWEKVEGLKNKQLSFFNDRSHPNLSNLDSLHASYPGWKEDFVRAEDAHYDGNQRRFERLLYKIEKKQCVHLGSRSHPQLMALDRLKLSYPGWQDDFSDAENTHYDFDGKVFWDKLEGLKSKEKAFQGDRSHPNLVELDSLHLTYAHWERDFKKAEDAHMSGNEWRFKFLIQKMKKEECNHFDNKMQRFKRPMKSLSNRQKQRTSAKSFQSIAQRAA